MIQNVRAAVSILAFLFISFCVHSSTEDTFLLEVEPYKRVKSFKYLGDMQRCPLSPEDFMRAAHTIVHLNELEQGRFWIRAEDFSVY
jgi:hypothetical protein